MTLADYNIAIIDRTVEAMKPREPFFSTPERIYALHKIAESWIGTPFRWNGRVKGPRGGCACNSLAFAIGVEAGWIPGTVQLPKGTSRTWRAQHQSLIAPFVDDQLPAEPFDFRHTEIKPGDLLWFADSESEHIVTMIAPPRFINCLSFGGVHYGRLDDANFLSRVQRAWRPIVCR